MNLSRILLLAFLPMSLLAQEKTFNITGRLNNIDTRYVTLTYWRAGKQIADTASVVDHSYTLKGTLTNYGTAVIKEGLPDDAASRDELLLFYLDAGTFRITHTGKFSDVRFEGSPGETEYLKLRAALSTFFQETEQLKTRQNQAKAGHRNDEASALGKHIDSLQAIKADQIYGSYIRNNPGSPILVYAFNSYYASSRGHSDPDKLTELFGMLPDSIREQPDYQAFLQQITNGKTFNTVVTIGKPAPDFTMSDTLGRPVALHSFRGHYVLLDFWASWCAPCRAENPNVVKQYAKYHGKGFEIVGVSLDQPGKKDSWLKAIHDDQLSWNHVSDLKFWDNAAVKLYGVQSIPQNFLIDPQGKIIARGLRGEELEKTLSQLYKN